MKDLSHLLKGTQIPNGFEGLDSAKEYVARYLINYINIELGGLPKEEWNKCLITWIKICSFAKSLIPKSDRERKKLYEDYGFDMIMEGIAEDVRHTAIGMVSMGILKENDPPHKLLLLALELIRDDQEMMEKWRLDKNIIEYMYEFFSSYSGKER